MTEDCFSCGSVRDGGSRDFGVNDGGCGRLSEVEGVRELGRVEELRGD